MAHSHTLTTLEDFVSTMLFFYLLVDHLSRVLRSQRSIQQQCPAKLLDTTVEHKLDMGYRQNLWVCIRVIMHVYWSDRRYRVNLGGWLVLEPFISPALFQKYPQTIDEWTLSEAMRSDTSPGGGIGQIEDHYNTFIVSVSII